MQLWIDIRVALPEDGVPDSRISRRNEVNFYINIYVYLFGISEEVSTRIEGRET